MFVGVYGWLWKKEGEKGRAWLEWGLAVLVAGVSLASVLTHEPWADELHTWLKTRELTVGQLWWEMAYEGHFLTWHLILHPFARLGAPVEAMGWISWVINAAAVAWFARKAPLGGWAKAATGLSCLFLYVNPAISRPYVLVPPVLFALAVLWQKRDARPMAFGLLVALLANTHVCMEGTAAAVAGVFAWENVLRRKDGKSGRQCRHQWAGLGVMAAGGALAMAQILPSLWKTGIELGAERMHPAANAGYFFMGCTPWIGPVPVAAGLLGLGVVAWRRDKGVFWMLAGGIGWMVALSLFVYPAHVANRALAWWPVMLCTAWMLAGKAGAEGRNAWTGALVAVTGLGLMRPDVTWLDWRREYDAMKGACQYIAERYGRDAEVWIDGQNYLLEGASAYLHNLWDWQTGQPAELVRFQAGKRYDAGDFEKHLDGALMAHSGQDCLVALALFDRGSGALPPKELSPGIETDYYSPGAGASIGPIVLKVTRGTPQERGTVWARTGMVRLAEGDREGGMDALARAAAWDAGQWEAMNNLAWLCVEDGRVEEARAWMDRAMANEEARDNAGVWDTEAAVRRAEGDEEGAKEAEGMRDVLRNAQLTMQNAQ